MTNPSAKASMPSAMLLHALGRRLEAAYTDSFSYLSGRTLLAECSEILGMERAPWTEGDSWQWDVFQGAESFIDQLYAGRYSEVVTVRDLILHLHARQIATSDIGLALTKVARLWIDDIAVANLLGDVV